MKKMSKRFKTKHCIPRKAKQQIGIQIVNPKVKEGYLPRIKVPENIYIGEAAVCSHESICYVLATSARGEDIEIGIEPQYIHPYYIMDSSNEDPRESYQEEPVNEKDRIHRTEIQRQVEALFSRGIVELSTSPYNSLCILYPRNLALMATNDGE